MSSYEIEQIKKSLRINDYLEDKGFSSLRQMGDRTLYRCPLPSHPGDNDPSFTVYDKGTHDDFYCYGCKCSGSIINLVAEMEQIGLRHSIRRLSEGLDINIDDMLDAAVRDIRNVLTGSAPPLPDEALHLSLYLGTLVHDFLVKVEKNTEDLALCDKIFDLIDKYAYAENIDELNALSEGIPEKLRNRYKEWTAKKEESVNDFSDLI